MRSRRLPALVVASVLFLVGASTSSIRETVAQDAEQIGVLEVRLPITVKDRNGFVLGLSQRNFQVYEDGKLQQIVRFTAPSDLPLRIALLMDTSNSVKLKLPFEKEAAEDFVSTVTTYRRRDKVLFATFNDRVELHQDFTDNEELLIRSIRGARAGGYTRLYDGVYRVIEEKMATLRGEEAEARRVMVVISDGADTASERSLREAVELAQQHDVTLFGISTKNFSGVGAGMVSSSDDKELRTLCESTGGQVFMPAQKLELFRSFSQVASDLRQEYVIYYTPDNQEKDGKQRSIRVRLVAARGQLFHKQGYSHR